MLDALAVVLGAKTLRIVTEKDLQAALHGIVREAGYDVVREHDLGEAGIVDLLVTGRTGEPPWRLPIGVELKIKGSPSEIIRQLQRYSLSEALGGLILGTTQRRHVAALGGRDTLGKHPFRVIHVGGMRL